MQRVATHQSSRLGKQFLGGRFDPFQFAGNRYQLEKFHRSSLERFQSCTNILDLGCGSGEFLSIAGQRGVRTFGIDNSDRAIDECRSKRLHVERISIMDFLNRKGRRVGEFDGVYCSHVIEHMSPDELVNFLDLLYARTRPGTKIVIITPNIEDLDVATQIFWLDVTHVRPYPGALLQRVLTAIGFHNVQFESIYGLGLSLDYVKRWIVDKVRFGKRVLRPNLVVSALR